MNMLSQEEDSLKMITGDSIDFNKSAKKQARLERREARQLKNIRPYNALAPTKAAFYSTILPGLGQAYTGKYWKIPVIYGALGTGIGIALWNQNEYDQLRDIYKNRLLGINTDRFYDQENNEAIASNEDIASSFKRHQQQKELSILITVGLYVLNIIDANVTAHLQQYNMSKNLTFNPLIKVDNYTNGPNYGLNLSYSFR